MTFDAWRGAVGGAWQRVLLYPGGLALAAGLLQMWLSRRGARKTTAQTDQSVPWSLTVWHVLGLGGAWLAIALLPLPAATPLRQPLDLPTAWALLDLPLLAVIFANLTTNANQAAAQRGARLVAGWLVGLPLLALVLALMGSAVGRLTLADLPSLSQAPLLGPLALLIWLAALVPWLHYGPWRSTPPASAQPMSASDALLNLRRLGHLLLVTHLLSAIPTGRSGLLADQRLIFAQLLLTLGLVFVLIDRLSRQRSPVVVGRVVWGLGLVGAAALAWHSVQPLLP